MELAWHLIAEDGPLQGLRKEVVENQVLSIGRSEDAGIIIEAAEVSREHARVHLKKGQVTVEDLGSQNGAYIDGARVQGSGELRVGSRLVIGHQGFKLELAQVESPKVAALKQRLIDLKSLPEHSRWQVGLPAIFIEAALFTGLALLLVARLGISEVGFFALFLTAASLYPRFERLIADNKKQVFVDKQSRSKANLVTARGILGMFLGICAAYLCAALSYTPKELARSFGFIFESVKLGDGSLFSRSFSDMGGIFQHNLSVMLVIVILCCLYRSYGALLTLGWNASVWVVVLVTLSQRAVGAQAVDPATWAMVFAAVTPHLVLEGVAYILAALSAIWYSRGLTRYALTLKTPQPISDASHMALAHSQDDILQDITTASIKGLVLALLVLGLAALVESQYLPWMLTKVQTQLGG